MVQFEGRFGGREILPNEVIAVPERRIIDLDFEMAEGAPAAGENFLRVTTQRSAQYFRRIRRLGQNGKRTGRVELHGSPVAPAPCVGELAEFLRACRAISAGLIARSRCQYH